MSSSNTNEPAKPLSAYALFFRDTVSAIKQQNPTCSFQELSKIVASMWDALDPAHKTEYDKRNEIARMEYVEQMRAYRMQQQEQQAMQNSGELQQQNVIPSTSKTAVISTNMQQNQQQVATTATAATQQSQQINKVATAPDPTAGSAQICTRVGCNKPAIINPDWEDEYCSNECVVIHCRTVFNDWVKSNLQAKQQPPQPKT